MNKVDIYDTTLRDGSQREGVSLSVTDKLKIAQKLDDFGISYIEGGWPGSNPKDIEFFRRARKIKFNNARLCAFGSTRRPGIQAAEDSNIKALEEAGTETVTIFG
ncbi:MAG: citramalate synthase, partial [Dethiobacteria bacterium]